MAFTHKSKRMAYDQIANGSATGRENIVEVGALGSLGDRTTRQSVDLLDTVFTANRVVELHPAAGSSTGDYVGQPTSATTPGYTSQTSYTSAIGELNTAI